MTELEAGLEAVLFAAGDAVPAERLAAALETSPEEVFHAAEALQSLYDFEKRGIMLLRLEDKLQLASRPLYAAAVRRATESRRPPSLSPAALEVLTIVAYRQPVTRAFIDQLRGVDSGGTVAGLVEKGLIEEAGRMDVPGRPILYRTTEAFLRVFSISSLHELPALPALEENEQMELDMSGKTAEQTGTE
ncbi:SMC-Scp complex subunit ScpB, partial [Agathobaculum desmolans]|uniref:SMC-Scp complex subunit ScpB n=1 Tax=Agathobaculum desmolans TaxID=39484 RepID=UPI0004E13B58